MTGQWILGLLLRAASLGAFLSGAAYAAYLVGPPLGAGAVREIKVAAAGVPLDPTNPSRTQVGRLRYLGGVALTSPDKGFGGLSGLMFEPACNRLLAVNDTGSWFILQPEESGDRLIGVRAAHIAPILDMKGQPPDRKYSADAEAVMRDLVTGDTLVWFELDHRAQRYRGVSACDPGTLATAAHAVDRPAAIRGWKSNRGVEAASVDGTAILLFAESEPAGAGRMAAVRLEGTEAILLSYPAPDGLLATSAAELGPGVHLLLQRRVPRMRRLAVTISLLRPGTDGRLEREEIARLEPPLTVDNMEGLAIRRERGRIFLYLVSDNNFLPVQRTLLMKFELLAG